jgi:hypothetical protein
MCIYWKMPKCGFRLPLTTFKKLLLRTWDVTPAQLTGVAWCTITSFEKLYEEASGPLGGRAPTIGMFNHYFSLVASNDYYTIRKKLGVIEIFDSNNTNIQRINLWNLGWVYILDSGSHKYLKKLCPNWKLVRSNLKLVLNFAEEDSDNEVISILTDIIEGWFITSHFTY